MDSLAVKHPSVKPDFRCHNVYIFAIIEAMNRGHINNTEGATLSQHYLDMMLTSIDSSMAPDKWTFNMVLNAWSRSGTAEMVAKAESLISVMELYHDKCDRTNKTQPNSNSYNSLMTCYSRSLLPDKADRAYSLLQKMKSLHLNGTNTAAKPDAITYNIVMNLFAKTRRKSSPCKFRRCSENPDFVDSIPFFVEYSRVMQTIS